MADVLKLHGIKFVIIYIRIFSNVSNYFKSRWKGFINLVLSGIERGQKLNSETGTLLHNNNNIKNEDWLLNDHAVLYIQ